MAKDLLTVIFKPEDLQRLLDSKPKKVVVRAVLEKAKLDTGKEVAYVKVYAESKGNTIEGTMGETVPGCPEPPCDPNEETPEK